MILAAGLGTRLKPFTDHHPKALATVRGKTLLEHAIRYLQRYDIYDVIVNVHHLASQIENTLTQNRGFGSRITLSDERAEVLETGGGLLKAAPYLIDEQDFVVMNTDILTTLDLHAMIHSHRQSGAIATLAVMHRQSSRYLLFDDRNILCGWKHTGTGEIITTRTTAATKAFAFSGIQILSGAVLQAIPFTGKFSLITLYLHLAHTMDIQAFDHTGDVFIDAGKPEDLAKAANLF